MIMEYLFIYLLQLSDVIRLIVSALCVFLIALLGLAVIVIVATEGDVLNDPEAVRMKSWWKKSFICPLVAVCFLGCIPTKSTLIYCGSVYLGKKAVQAITTSEKLQKIDTIINLELDKRINELKGEQ
jgi:hypothetical protein